MLTRDRTHPRGPRRAAVDETRSPFFIDYDRVVFSSAFRRLQDKTQVFALAQSDYTRTRLTHSLEVASVGRSLGRRAYAAILASGVELGISEMELATVISAACLAHDLGNPPLGHSGEAAIGQWAKRRTQELVDQGRLAAGEAMDLANFEGNAQGFRILTRLQMRDRVGGMRPTGAMVGALAKYPCPALLDGRPRNPQVVAEKKFGFFVDDAISYRGIYEHMGFEADSAGAYCRHPLAFLVEAADDICYGIIDLEDAHKCGIVSYRTARELLNGVAGIPLEQLETASTTADERITRLRAVAISRLVDEVGDRFEACLGAIESGLQHTSLIAGCSSVLAYEHINVHMQEHVYIDARVLTIEIAGFQTLGGLLDIFSTALLTDTPSGLDKKVRSLFPRDLIREPGADVTLPFQDALARLSPYQRLLAVTDFVSGMTDSFAVDLYQRLSGTKI